VNVDYRRMMAFAAVLGEGDAERIIGIARYAATDERSCNCEFAATVADEWQHRGVATTECVLKKRPLPQLGPVSCRVSGGHPNDPVQQPEAAQSSRCKKQKQPANSGVHNGVSKHAYKDDDGTRTKQ
jgi:hypothetical protein